MHWGSHPAAVIDNIGQPFKIKQRVTPAPGPNELLIEVHAVALNHMDWAQRDHGYQIAHRPGVTGHDISGVVVAAGYPVPWTAPKIGTSVAALSIAFYSAAQPDYGAFQKYVLVPASNAFEIPKRISLVDAATLPVAVTTALTGLWSLSAPRCSAAVSHERRGILVWGAASSVGNAVVQGATAMGFTVYATASSSNHALLIKLGAAKVFDYRNPGVVHTIVSSAKVERLSINAAFNAASKSSRTVLEILSQVMTPGYGAELVSTNPLDDGDPLIPAIQVNFVTLPHAEIRHEHVHKILTDWLKPKLENGSFVPSPKPEVLPGGLRAVNSGLDRLKAGVKARKLVIKL